MRLMGQLSREGSSLDNGVNPLKEPLLISGSLPPPQAGTEDVQLRVKVVSGSKEAAAVGEPEGEPGALER